MTQQGSKSSGTRLATLTRISSEFNSVQALLGVFWSLWFVGLSVATLNATSSRFAQLDTPFIQTLIKITYVIGIATSAYFVPWYLDVIKKIDVATGSRASRKSDAEIYKVARATFSAVLIFIVVLIPLVSSLLYTDVNPYQALLSTLVFIVFLRLLRK